MQTSQDSILPPALAALRRAVEGAVRAIPPAFPLEATVAVNPFLGQADEGLAMAAARLARVAGQPLILPRATFVARIAAGEITEADLTEALAACDSPDRPADLGALRRALANPPAPPQALPTVAELACTASGTDWQGVVARSIGLWASGHFDRGQALWTPAPGREAYPAWREWATHDLTPELAGLTGFCAHVAAAPDSAERAIQRATARLGLTEAAAPTAFHRLLIDLGGWAQHARVLLWQAEQAGATDPTLSQLLAIRLLWEEALFAAHEAAIGDAWATTVAAHAAPLQPTADQVVDAILQEAAERAEQRRLATRLDAAAASAPSGQARPRLQAAFCIDVRSEVFRRHLEAQDASIETLGFAGFFGLPLAHRPEGSTLAEARLPVLLAPALETHADVPAPVEEAARIGARAKRAWGRFRQAAVSSFAFVEAAGPLYLGKLACDAVGLGGRQAPAPAPVPTLQLDPVAKAATAAKILRAMSLTTGHARLVLLLGHGGRVTNSPHASAYHCGACGGHDGSVSARLLAGLLNDPETRAGLPALGIQLPEDTVFLAGLHETTTDAVTLFTDSAPLAPADEIAVVRRWLAAAGVATRAERASRLPGATARRLAARARNWAEPRPEWGLAGCAAFLAAPRATTRRADLGGRVFLHSYEWRQDVASGFATLELILTAPVVVASWISLQYYGSAVAPALFGGGNKLIHNVVGGIGVLEGNGGRLRTGLPWQAVHDGSALAHAPLRLAVLVEAPREAVGGILERHPAVRALFDHGWLHLLLLEEGRVVARYRPGSDWSGPEGLRAAA